MIVPFLLSVQSASVQVTGSELTEDLLVNNFGEIGEWDHLATAFLVVGVYILHVFTQFPSPCHSASPC